MAKITTINNGSISLKIANVSAPVGKNGVNRPDDVKLVKNLFHLINSDSNTRFVEPTSLPVLGTGTVGTLPEIIELYQLQHNLNNIKYALSGGMLHLSKVKADGRISPAKGTGFYGHQKLIQSFF